MNITTESLEQSKDLHEVTLIVSSRAKMLHPSRGWTESEARKMTISPNAYRRSSGLRYHDPVTSKVTALSRLHR
jgi:hypothetical protein